VPPSITFDLPASTDTAGNMVWGSKVTYRLALSSKETDNGLDNDGDGIVGTARIMRDEAPAGAGGAVTTSVVEEQVPYRVTENGVTYWGFAVSRSVNALTVSIRRSGNTHKILGNTVQANGSTQGTVATSIVKGVYYLRNSQVAIPAQ
jgi:hypothetical protein